ncbi:uncharacterized protein DMAD_04521 [Drosophila madeirensis]|uniref:CCDC113/CCDC96 coiled-coil domain-containing protein n=1 Tax=Drosophila madeirensis TaxID=30013 RepID=A0AAU9GDA9_DROMD
MAETAAEEAAAMQQEESMPMPHKEETDVKEPPNTGEPLKKVDSEQPIEDTHVQPHLSDSEDMHPPVEGEETEIKPTEGEGTDPQQSGSVRETELQRVAEEHKREKKAKAKLMLKRIKGVPADAATEEGTEWPEEDSMEGEEKDDDEQMEDSHRSSEDSSVTDVHSSDEWAERVDFLEEKISIESLSDLEDTRGPPEHNFMSAFLREFESLPSLSDISENSTSSRIELEIRPTAEPERVTVDPGRFVQSVDRYSGSSSSARSLSGSSETSVHQLIVEEEEEPEALSQSSFLGSLIEEPEPAPKELIIQDDADIMAQIYIESESEDDGKEVVDPKVAAHILVKKITIDFLDSLINRVVQICEIGARAKLFDKGKMLEEIERLVNQFVLERYTNSILNNKMGEHYKRNRKPDKYATLPSQVEVIEGRRYIAALNLVDSLMERSTIIKKNGCYVISRAQLELHACYTLSKFVTENLESCMRQNLLRQDSDRLRRLLDAELRRMENLRNEISEKRYELNLNLRSLAVMAEKMRLVERITDDLTTSQVQNATDNIIHLDKRLEDRTKDVLAMQGNYKKFLIEKTCIREKRTMIAESLGLAKNVLYEKGERLNELRHHLSDIQAKRLKIKTTHAKLQAKGGLLFQPALMYEYDKCLEEVEGRRVTVGKLRKTYKDLTSRLSMLERAKTTATVASV